MVCESISDSELVERIAKGILGVERDRARLIAFDGVDTSGKTTLANRVQDCLRNDRIDSVRVSIDKFHNPKEIRNRRGAYSPEGFFHDSFDYARIKDLVIDPVMNGRLSIATGAFDYRTDRDIAGNVVGITKDTIILFDGIFLNRDELCTYWDLSIFLDVSFDTVRKRAVERDTALFGTEGEVLAKYERRYIPGERIYLSSCEPKERASIVIDNNDWRNPAVKKWRV